MASAAIPDRMLINRALHALSFIDYRRGDGPAIDATMRALLSAWQAAPEVFW